MTKKRKLTMIVAMAGMIGVLPAATCEQVKEDTKTVLDVAKVLCITANATLPNAQVAAICGIAEALIPTMDSILSEQRTSARRFAASQLQAAHCGPLPDAGP